jgi:cation diffusion facilitator CzcD-associated flavoprotein CzcO
MNPDWTQAYASSKEIWAYLSRVARKYSVYERTKFNHSVDSCKWNEANRKWTVEVLGKDGNKTAYVVDYLISGIGALHVPAFPNVPGVGSFKGREVHAAEWREDIDCRGKRVIVVGSAASAVQVVPSVAEVASQVTVIQRTPNWLAPQHSPVLPNNLRYGSLLRWCFRNLPGFLWLHRIFIYLSMEVVHSPLGLFAADESKGQRLARVALRRYMLSQLKGNKKLAEKVIPKYAVGCKRIIRSERFLPALLRPNVELVVDQFSQVEDDGIIINTKNGPRKIEADILVYATGYQVGSLGKMQLKGCGDHLVTGSYMVDNAMDSYYGVCNPLFPNSFLLLGPNTGLGHNSIIIMSETQANFIARCIELATDEKINRLAVKQVEVDQCMKFINETLENTVWKAGHCNSWYQNQDGKVPTIWPGSTVQYMMDLSPPNDLHVFDCVKTGVGQVQFQASKI